MQVKAVHNIGMTTLLLSAPGRDTGTGAPQYTLRLAADSAEAISSRLAGFQQGSRRARAAARGAHSPDEQP